VLLHLFRDLGLEAMLEELLPQGQAVVSPVAIVTSLVLQRCVDPGSKLYASRWTPRTALPELLRFAPSNFNNTRLHRVLDDLDRATRPLMAKLPTRYAERDGAFTALFLDVTDTWFVGEGPALAARGKTKEGRIERKVGIVLMCNEHGLPLRWEVIQGSHPDNAEMTRMLRSVASMNWASRTPIVCDRAMGRTAEIRELLATKLWFVTAVTVTEMDAYAPTLPHGSFADLDVISSDEQDPTAIEAKVTEVERRAERSKMKKVSDDLFVLDLGILVRAQEKNDRLPAATAHESATARAMRLSREMDDALAQGRVASGRAAGRALGLRRTSANNYRALRRLSEQQQRDVLDGKVAHCSLAALLAVAAIEDPDEQQKAFKALVAASVPSSQKRPRAPHARAASSNKGNEKAPPQPVRVRVVAYFNPERFVEERRIARRKLDRIDALVAELRAKIAASPGRYKPRGVAASLEQKLREESLFDVYKVDASPATGAPGVTLTVTFDRNKWARRRRYDGFTVLVSHPDLVMDAAALCRLYRAKDAVEKDFQIIKSVVQLRPVWHQTDAKVRAHVTLCMLALLLERTLGRALQPIGVTAERAREALATCCLNLYPAKRGQGAYCVTEVDAEQRAILKAMNLLHLADDDDLSGQIRPR
jgi:transposase